MKRLRHAAWMPAVVVFVAAVAALPGCATSDGAGGDGRSAGRDAGGAGGDGPAAPSPPTLTAPGFRALGPALAVSAQPTDADLAAAAAAGYRTVVNFRTPGEPGYVDQRAAAESLGLRYVSIPVAGTAITAAHADQLAPTLAPLLSDPGHPAAAPVLMHCRSGTRARQAWAVWLALHAGEPPDTALARASAAGLSGDPLDAARRAIETAPHR